MPGIVFAGYKHKPAKHVAFGVGSKKLGRMTIHPRLDEQGLFTARDLGCDPALYSPKPIYKIYPIRKNRPTTKDVWRYKVELEEWSQNLGYRNPQILAERRFRRSVLGPLWYEVKQPQGYEPACRNMGFSRCKRPDPFQSNPYPGPGNYKIDKPKKLSHSILQSFDQTLRCRFADFRKPWSLAPNRYKYDDPNDVANLSKKVVSLKGPYQLFSGKRGLPFSIQCQSASWPISFKDSFNRFEKSHYGEMNKTGRDRPYAGRMRYTRVTVVDPDEPGPAHYNLAPPRQFKASTQPFNSGDMRPRSYKRVELRPGVGTYDTKTVDCGVKGQGWKSSFISKVERSVGGLIIKPYNTF